MNGAQITWIVMNVLALGIILAKHGQKKEENYNFVTFLIEFGIEYAILKWGGFF